MSKTIYTTSMLCGLLLCLFLAGCGRQSLPAAGEFHIPAVGTLIPGQHEEAVKPELVADVGGILMINQIGVEVQVAVSSTITTIPNGSSFLFLLPPTTYDFYIYQPGKAPLLHTEAVPSGRIRYVYLSPQVPAR
jgi:hypothetical protein